MNQDEKNKETIESINNSAKIIAAEISVLLLFALFLAFTLVASDDKALLIGTVVQLPQGATNISLFHASWFLPLAFVFLHLTLLSMLNTLRLKIRQLRLGDRQVKEIMHANLLPYAFLRIHFKGSSLLMRLLTFLGLAGFPLLVLFGIAITFIDYQHRGLSFAHLFLIVLDSSTVFWFYCLLKKEKCRVFLAVFLAVILAVISMPVYFFSHNGSCPKEDEQCLFTLCSRDIFSLSLKNEDLFEPLSEEVLASAVMKETIPQGDDGISLEQINKIKTDLGRGLNLSNRSFRCANFQNSRFSNVIFDHSDLRKADLSEASLRGASLEKANLTGAKLAKANLAGADLTEADLTGAKLAKADLTEADLTGAKLLDTNLAGANLAKADLTGVDLLDTNLAGADLTGADLTGADLAGADLTGAKLAKADLTEADLTGADLSRANLAGADLRWADLAGAELMWADLAGADLSGAGLAGADLSWADLTGAKLAKAGLAGAELMWADLAGADLSGAGLAGADLSWADLAGADLTEADLSGADLWLAGLAGSLSYESYLHGADFQNADFNESQWYFVILLKTKFSPNVDTDRVFFPAGETTSGENYISYLESHLPDSGGRWKKEDFLAELHEKLKKEHDQTSYKRQVGLGGGARQSLLDKMCGNQWIAKGVVRNQINAWKFIKIIAWEFIKYNPRASGTYIIRERHPVLPEITYEISDDEWNSIVTRWKETSEWLLEKIRKAQKEADTCIGLKNIREEEALEDLLLEFKRL